MNIIHAAQVGQGGPVPIASVNLAKVDLGVPFDRLTERWPRLSVEIFRLDKWSVCRG
jgi:hypothetical protein